MTGGDEISTAPVASPTPATTATTATAASGAVADITLRPGGERAVLAGHPWVFAGSIARLEGPADASLARLADSRGRRLALGFHSPRSQIRVRLLAGAAPDAALVDILGQRLDEALALRRAVVPADTTGYRLLNAEGDGVPGWTIDRFGDTLVSQVTVAGLEARRDEAYAALIERLAGLGASRVLQVDDLPARQAEGLPSGAGRRQVVHGEPGAEAVFSESGLTFTADLAGGQKTGFYCDQRDSRRLCEQFAGGRSVLDLFAHTGAFGLYAWRGGAAAVTHVESSARAIERGQRHYELNGREDRLTAGGGASWVKADVWEDLRQRQEAYDLVICDPPPLARKRSDLPAAARAYRDLNRLAIGRLRAGGMLMTWSCSGSVDAALFGEIVAAAAAEAGARLTLLQRLGAGADHPVAVAHPQGEYLKGWLAWRR